MVMGSNPVTPGLSQNGIDQKVSKKHQTKSREKNVKNIIKAQSLFDFIRRVFQKEADLFLGDRNWMKNSRFNRICNTTDF